MSKKFFQAFCTTLCIFLATFSAQAQGQQKGEKLSTPLKLVMAKMKLSEGEAYEVRGKALFTLAAANADGSFAGTLDYQIPDDARAKIAQIAGKQITQIPVRVSQKDVVATLQKGTACPTLHLEFTPLDLNISGVNLHINRFVLDVNDEGQKLQSYMCVVARQINTGRPFRGVTSAINAALTGEEPDAEVQSKQ
ncbi:MAG TPA: hypothetical protein VEF04_07245 [Blastocatellia bacterium]|nr:hypothetical protein [Blastocatellia bacterium]